MSEKQPYIDTLRYVLAFCNEVHYLAKYGDMLEFHREIKKRIRGNLYNRLRNRWHKWRAEKVFGRYPK